MATRPKKKPRPAPVADAGIRTLYERSPIGIAELDDKGRFTRFNAAFEKLLGRAAKEIRTLTFDQVTHTDDIAGCVNDFNQLVKGEIDHFEMEKRFVRKNGEIVWAHTVVAADRAGKRARGMIGMAIDVTERRRAQEELERLKAALEKRVEERTAELTHRDAVLSAQQESSPDGILVVNAEGRMVSYNKRFVEMWGIPAPVLAGRSDEMAIASVLSKLVDPEGFLKRVRQLYENREEKTFDELALLDGRVFERYSCPARDERGGYHGRVWYFHDVTPRVAREKELREATRALSESNAGLSIYAYAASHDLHAPLRKIITFGNLLKERAKDKLGAEELDFLERMRNAAAAAAQLVTDLLTLSQVSHETHPLEEVDFNSVLLEIEQELAAELAASGARVEAGRLPVLRAHPVLLHSLLLNLISNAVKFRRPGEPPVVCVGSRRDGDFVEITVADNGIGFDQAYAEKIFQPFLRLNAASVYQGSGIGLTICLRVAQRYGGSLTADSEPGRGTTFTLRLPAAMLATV